MRLARIGLNAPRNLTQSRAGDTFDKCQSIDPSSFHQTLPLPKNKQCCISVAKTLVYLVVQVLWPWPHWIPRSLAPKTSTRPWGPEREFWHAEVVAKVPILRRHVSRESKAFATFLSPILAVVRIQVGICSVIPEMLQLELVSEGLAGLLIPYTTKGKPQASSQDPVEISSCWYGSTAPVDAVNQCFATEFPSGCEDHQILVLSRFPWMLIVRGFALHHKDGLTNTISW